MEVYIAIIGIVITFAVPVIIHLRERKRNSIVNVVLANTPLITVDEEIEGKIRILFKKTRVQNIGLLLLKIWNDGNVDIEPSDFISPLILRFGEHSRILSCEITSANPEHLAPEFNVFSNYVEVTPLLLNSNESFQLKLLLTSFEGEVKVESRIKGIREIKTVTEAEAVQIRKNIVSTLAWLFWIVIFMQAFVLLFWLYPYLRGSTGGSGFTWGYVYGLLSALVLGLILGRIQRSRLKMRVLKRSKLPQKG